MIKHLYFVYNINQRIKPQLYVPLETVLFVLVVQLPCPILLFALIQIAYSVLGVKCRISYPVSLAWRGTSLELFLLSEIWYSIIYPV